MKGTSKVIMGATLVMVVTLAIVLGLILVLLAELYCSLLLRRRRHLRNTTAATQTALTRPNNASSSSSSAHSHPSTSHSPSPPPPFSSIYAQGVLQPPRSFLFPKEGIAEPKKHPSDSELQHVIQIQPHSREYSNPSFNPNNQNNQIGLVSVSSPLASFISRAPPKPIQEVPIPLQGTTSPSSTLCPEKTTNFSGGEQNLVYISNPIYENDQIENRGSGANNTPFETPNTSPSHFERSGSSGDDDGAHSPTYTPPLTPMKKLPSEACSVSLRDARSLGTSGSESRSNNCLSSSSSGSLCTSPSW